MKQDIDWTSDAGQLNQKLYHTDCLHLIETGNEKFAKSIANVLYKVIEGREIDYPSDESDFIRPAPYVAPVLFPVLTLRPVFCSVSCVTPRPVLCSVSMSRNAICPNTLPLNKGVNSPKPKWEKCWYVHCPPVPLSPVRKHVSKTISSSVRKPVSKPISSSVCKRICKPVSTCVRNCVDTVPRFYTSNIYNFNNTFFNSTFTNLFFNSGNALFSFNLTFINLFFKIISLHLQVTQFS